MVLCMNGKEKSSGIVIPMERLSEDSVNGLIEEFILREGTDYGHFDYTLDQKKTQLLKQLKSRHIIIVFDLIEETTTLMRKEDALKKLDLISDD